MKKLSKQEQWQKKQQAAGLCCLCNEPLFTKWHCEEHAKIQREAARARYRKRVGIDINAPLVKTGRKRIEEVEL